MPTPLQIKLIHIAAGQVWPDRAQREQCYRTLLKNVAGVESSKALDQAGFEDVMAVLEDMGFDGADAGTRGRGDAEKDSVSASPRLRVSASPRLRVPASPSYWRDKVRDRGHAGNARMIHLIRRLAEHSIYPLDRLAWRQSGGRTSDVEALTPREAWMLIEMLKSSNQRKEAADAAEKHRQPSLF